MQPQSLGSAPTFWQIAVGSPVWAWQVASSVQRSVQDVFTEPFGFVWHSARCSIQQLQSPGWPPSAATQSSSVLHTSGTWGRADAG